jgi:uncharacterized BrkB/YihY/UPF0761 family membrane protein
MLRRAAQRVFAFYWGRGIADDVPALTYYLVLSLAPFALGVAALQALALRDTGSALDVATQLNRFLPEGIHDDVRRLVLRTRSDSPRLLILAIASMLWTSSGAIGVIERCESRLLGCPRHGVIVGRLRNIVLGAAVAATVAVGIAGAPVLGDAAAVLRVGGHLPSPFGLIANAAVSVLLIAGVYRFAPRSVLRWRSSLLGALPAGIAMQAIPALVGVYVGAAAGFAAVQLFLILAVVLLGLFVVATFVLVGAGLAVEAEHRARERGAAAPSCDVPAEPPPPVAVPVGSAGDVLRRRR